MSGQDHCHSLLAEKPLWTEDAVPYKVFRSPVESIQHIVYNHDLFSRVNSTRERLLKSAYM